MGKTIRAACVVVTAIALSCLGIVMVGQLSSDNKAPLTPLGRDLYFLKADTSHFTADLHTISDQIQAAGNRFDIDTNIVGVLTDSASSKALKDFYLIGLWSYCEGETTNGVAKITYCSSPTSRFWFDPTDVWGLKNTLAQNVLGDNLQKGLHYYAKVMRWMVSAFVLAAISTAVVILASFFALRSRIARLVTFYFWLASSSLTIAAAITATVVYSALVGLLRAALEPHDVSVSIGSPMLGMLWFGVVLSIPPGPIWFLSIFCSG